MSINLSVELDKINQNFLHYYKAADDKNLSVAGSNFVQTFALVCKMKMV